MLQVRNSTPFAASLALSPDVDGIDSVIAIVKGTFTLSSDPRPLEAQRPVVPKAEFHGDPASSSVKVPSDVSLPKPTTDVLMFGHAHAPNGRSAHVVDVALHVGGVYRAARVFGDRVWRQSATATTMTSPEPFAMMPVVWERAYGGFDETDQGRVFEARNPVGTGFRDKSGELGLDGVPLPNVEDPRALITTWRDRPAPVGFGPIGEHWMPRRDYAGTYDDAWRKERCPYLPLDFDARFLHVAQPELVTPARLAGGEPIRISGMSPATVIDARVPTAAPVVQFVVSGSVESRPTMLDTLMLLPDDGVLCVVWRAVLPCDKRVLQVSEVRVSLARP